MLDLDVKEEYRLAVVHHSQAQEILKLARCHRSRALCALIESDYTLSRAIELALKDDVFYEMLKAWVLEYLPGKVNDAA